ncbi:MAG: hypothetical protein KDA81_15565 [Planctomycetaceae bacterium]|nr:hypothetical protein [Planctomycetaceae bacterium]MCA9085480.1 hypothetical protein [Planctomycetaceae bacterium]
MDYLTFNDVVRGLVSERVHERMIKRLKDLKDVDSISDAEKAQLVLLAAILGELEKANDE